MLSKRIKDIRGQRFGILTAIRIDSISKNGTSKWLCDCDCGNKYVVFSTALRRGTSSCGCLTQKKRSEDRTIHGYYGSPTYNSWRSMKSRCDNSNNPDYHRYGGRGISYQESWISFEKFLLDMGERPVDRSLDREDNDGNYSSENCRWSSAKDQANNRRLPQRK